MPVYPLLFMVNLVFVCFWMYFQFAFWKGMRRSHPDLYNQIGPENLVFGVSLWNLGKTFLFLARGKHRDLAEKSPWSWIGARADTFGTFGGLLPTTSPQGAGPSRSVRARMMVSIESSATSSTGAGVRPDTMVFPRQQLNRIGRRA